MKGKKFTVEFTVSEVWIEDGFNMDDERALEMLSYILPYADMDSELSAKVVKKEATTN